MDKTIEELTLILAYLTQLTTYDRMTKSNDTFSFKSYDYNVLTELSKKGLIDIGDKPFKRFLYFSIVIGYFAFSYLLLITGESWIIPYTFKITLF